MDQNAPSSAVALPPGVELLHLSQMKWESSKSGRQNAYLLGHPGKPGPYIYKITAQ